MGGSLGCFVISQKARRPAEDRRLHVDGALPYGADPAYGYRRLAENYRSAEQRRLAEDDIASSTVLLAVSVSVLFVLGLVLCERKKAALKTTRLRAPDAVVS